VIAVGLTGAASVLCLLTAAGHLLTGGEDGFPAVFAFTATEVFGPVLVDEELGALDTCTAEDLEDHLVELYIVDGTGQLVVAKVPGTAVIVLPTATTEFAVFQYAHTGIGESANLALLCGPGCHLHDGSPHDLVWTEDTVLDAHD